MRGPRIQTRMWSGLGLRRWASLFAAVGFLAVSFAAFVAVAPAASASGPFILRVGEPGEMKTRNPLPAIANDIPTQAVLRRVYFAVGLEHPVTGELVPYILKGVDADGDGRFERTEKGAFYKGPCEPSPCTPAEEVAWRRTIVAAYDFNGVYYHDGWQATIGDVMFNYVLQSLNPRFTPDLRVLWDDPNSAGFPRSRHLNIDVLGCGVQIDWEESSALPGDNNLRCALRYRLQDDFARFYRSTLTGLTLFPRHLYEGTGGGRHADFGFAIYPENWAVISERLKGIPVDETLTRPLDYPAAEGWPMTDADVIGTGPFKFGTWSSGAFARVDKNPDFFYGVNPSDPTIVYDPALLTYLHPPFIDAIQYKTYRTMQLGLIALQSGEVDFYHRDLPPGIVWEGSADPGIAVVANLEMGYTYLAYQMRRAPFGYEANDPGKDVGYPLRRAISHLVDKQTIVRTLLLGIGAVAHGVVSPANTFWYNPNLPKPVYDPALAASILDSPEARAAGIGPDPNGPCSPETPDGCRILPRLGNRSFDFVSIFLEYDPIRYQAAEMIESSLRDAGLNARLRTFVPGPVTEDPVPFDLFILAWRIRGTDPDYLHSFFHSSNAAAGPNLPGFRNATFDATIEECRAQLDDAARRECIWRAQEIIAELRPVEPLYHQANVEAYRKDRYVGWTTVAGTIWNDASLLALRPPLSEAQIFVSVLAPPTLPAGASSALQVTVREPSGAPVSGASVSLSVPPGNGTFAGGSCTGTNACTGLTGPTGVFIATYVAPSVVPGPVDVTLRLTARSPDPDVPIVDLRRTITVVPSADSSLSIELDVPAGTSATPGAPFPMGVLVRDLAGSPAPGANVTVEVVPFAPATPSSWISGSEVRTVRITFPGAGSYRVFVNATGSESRSASSVVSIQVLDIPPPGVPPAVETPPIDSLILATIAAGPITAILVATGVVLRAVRRSRKR